MAAQLNGKTRKTALRGGLHTGLSLERFPLFGYHSAFPQPVFP
uniref:Uncharacterized protein n=1 Tax=Rhodocyclus tenuis TaxID=1066 RepID=A0A840FYB7_RHOTE|nr:hypothetical protein [Rhodocyclus tenuis]